MKQVSTINAETLEKVAYILKTIGHPVRLSIIQLLMEHQELTVNDLCEKLEVEQSQVSHHLNNMKMKKILASRRDGKNVYYNIELDEVTHVIKCMSNCNI